MTSARSTASSSPWLDALTTAIGPVIWGSTYIVTTELLPPDRPFTAALLRTLPAGLLLVLWCRRGPAWGDGVGWLRLLVLAALNIGAFQALLFVAAYRLPGGVAAVVGTLCMAAGTVWSRRWRPGLPVLAFTGWQLLAGGVMLAPVAWAVDPPLPALTATHIAGYLYLSLAGALVAYALWFRGIARLPSVAVSSLGLLSPVTAVLLGWVLLGQAMTGVSLVGMLVVLASILAVQWAMSRAVLPAVR